MNYIELIVEEIDATQSEIIVAELDMLGYTGFQEEEKMLRSYIPQTNYNETVVKAVLENYKIKFSTSVIAEQNWNALWESNFEPVLVGDFCLIRADFHEPSDRVEHEIIITPKMSFGTGHHATTFMMVQQMQKLNFTNAEVADFGTGTGILAILAEKLGAKTIQAIDCDDWSINNANENIWRNKCNNIELIKSESFSPKSAFNIILANINKNVILDNLESLVFGLKPSGTLLTSGFLPKDENDILQAFSLKGLRHIHTEKKDNWISILMQL